MTFEEVLGQDLAIATLRQALRTGRLHHAYRFEGPDGVGKEQAALALARALVCPNSSVDACEACSTCSRSGVFSETPPTVPLHPDIVLVGRGVYTGSLISSKELNGISVEQIRRVVLARARYAPHEGQRLVFIIRDADELTPASANALLKTLEEPRLDVNFILLTHRPHRLLDTIRSRTLAIRFGRLPDAVIEEVLVERGKAPEFAARANGSIGDALRLAESDELVQLDDFIRSLEQTLDAPDLGSALEFATKLPKDKTQLQERLRGFAAHLARRARATVARAPQKAGFDANAYQSVSACLVALEKNASPQLTVESLLAELKAAWQPAASG